MQVINTQFGEVKVDEASVFEFSQGLPGFDELRRFVFIPQGEESPIQLMQCLDDLNIAFVVANPIAFFENYALEVGSEDLSQLELTELDEAINLVILVVSSDPKQTTANLQAPIILNPKNLKGRQVVMLGDKYSTNHKLLA